MANILFNRVLLESGDFLLLEDSDFLLLEDQEDIVIVIDYTNMAYVDASNRTIFINRGN